MRIMGLKAENVKRLKMVEITPEGNVVKVTGKNGNGKTSVLDSIILALGGDAAVKLTKTTKPIHNGADRAESTVDLGEYIVTRTWTASGSTLKVTTKDGAKISSPQALLTKFVGNLTFDPLEFMNMKSEDQVQTLHRIIGFDPKPLDDKRKKLFDDRTVVNRQVKDLQAKMKDISTFPGVDLPEAEVEAATLMDEFSKASETLLANNKLRVDLNVLREESAAQSKLIVDLETQIRDLLSRLDMEKEKKQAIVDKGISLRAQVDSLVDPELGAIQLQMTNLESTNRKIRSRNEWKKLDKELEDKAAKAYDLTNQIEDIDQQKENAIKNAKLPIAGLSFGIEGVEYNGIPLSQSSHAEKIRVSMAMGMSINPELRVMFIKDGEKFDSDTWKMVEAMAAENDYQVWAEVVDETGEVGIYIEDGMVKDFEEKIIVDCEVL